jgi:LacI family repressor for deo operon, udp, cdd, tsx, nupC, and nupG
MATIDDVAKRAGLSKTTVSRVINNHPYVSEKKKNLVHEAMKQLGYVPNSSAQRLRNQKTETIAVFIPRITNPFFSQLIESMEISASDKGYQLIVCQTRDSAQKELNYLDNLLKKKQVDGVILTSIQNKWKTIECYLQYGPIVFCNEFDENVNVPIVRINQTLGGYIATKHLLELGHTKLAYCSGGTKSSVASGREEGFLKALSEYGLDICHSAIFRTAFNINDGRKIFRQLSKLNDPPTAVFTGSDEVAAGIIFEAKQNGWKIPNDLAVVGFDNQSISQLIEPSITTVEQPVEMMAEKAMDILVEKIESKVPLTCEIHEYPINLIVRQSTSWVSD